MTTEIIDAKERELTKKELSLIKETIISGGLVVFPTETVYGLGADGTSEKAALAVYRAKGRPSCTEGNTKQSAMRYISGTSSR